VAGQFAVACLLLDAAIAARLDGAAVSLTVVYLGLTSGQLALAATWCVRGRLPWLVRWTATGLCAVFLASGWARVTYATVNQWSAVLCLYLIGVAITWKVVGYALGSVPQAGEPARMHANRSRHHDRSRWSLGGMLSVMTCVGIVLGPGRWLTFPWPYAGNIAGLFSALIVVAVVSTWAMTATPRQVTRFGMIGGVSILAGLLMAWVDPSFTAWHYAWACLLEAAVICFGHGIVCVDQKSWRSI